MLGVTELIIILIATGVIVFGSKRGVGDIARSLGKFSGEFRKGKEEAKKGIEEIKKEIKM